MIKSLALQDASRPHNRHQNNIIPNITKVPQKAMPPVEDEIPDRAVDIEALGLVGGEAESADFAVVGEEEVDLEGLRDETDAQLGGGEVLLFDFDALESGDALFGLFEAEVKVVAGCGVELCDLLAREQGGCDAGGHSWRLTEDVVGYRSRVRSRWFKCKKEEIQLCVRGEREQTRSPVISELASYPPRHRLQSKAKRNRREVSI